MNDPRKSAEALKKIQELQVRIKSHTSRISQLESDKNNKIKQYDQQIQNERYQITQHTKEIEMLKRQI
jgi:DNA-binding response OmpR family regulator